MRVRSCEMPRPFQTWTHHSTLEGLTQSALSTKRCTLPASWPWSSPNPKKKKKKKTDFSFCWSESLFFDRGCLCPTMIGQPYETLFLRLCRRVCFGGAIRLVPISDTSVALG